MKVSHLSIPLFSKENTIPHIAHVQHVVLNENAFFFAQNCQKTVMFEPSLLRFAFLKPHSTNIGCHFLNKPKKQLLGIKKTLV